MMTLNTKSGDRFHLLMGAAALLTWMNCLCLDLLLRN